MTCSRGDIATTLRVEKTKIGARIGRLADEDIARMNRAVVVFLGIGGLTVTRRPPAA
jgi:hypothetical protein